MWQLCTILAVFATICATQPVENLPVLKEVPAEINFRVPSKDDLVLHCATVTKDAGIKYSWLKDGKPLNPRSNVKQLDGEGTLVFKNPEDSDQGLYQCMAQTALGVASSRVIEVKKYFIEKPKVIPQKHKPVEGKTFKLECVIPKSYPKPGISWIVKSGSESKPVSGAKFTISPEGTLYLASVSAEDVGNKKYVCFGNTPAEDEPVVLAEHILEDMVPSKGPKNNEVVQQYVSEVVTAQVGETIFLYCIYGGDPLAHPDWFKDGKDINNSAKDRITRYNKSVGKRLVIKEVWASDEGEYTCRIDNGVGKPQEHKIRLNVVAAPKISKPTAPMLNAKAGEDVILECHVTGIPEPTLSWTKNAQPFADNRVTKDTSITKDTSVTKDTSITTTVVAKLKLRAVTKSDVGYYGCKAHNEHGDSYVETLLNVQ